MSSQSILIGYYISHYHNHLLFLLFKRSEALCEASDAAKSPQKSSAPSSFFLQKKVAVSYDVPSSQIKKMSIIILLRPISTSSYTTQPTLIFL